MLPLPQDLLGGPDAFVAQDALDDAFRRPLGVRLYRPDGPQRVALVGAVGEHLQKHGAVVGLRIHETVDHGKVALLALGGKVLETEVGGIVAQQVA